MKLLCSPTSPFSRKVRILVLEAGLHDQIKVVRIDTEDPGNGLVRYNPLQKIPVLETKFGPLYDSPVICEYLDTLHDGPKWIPLSGTARWNALCWQAMADGLQDAALLMRYEAMQRPAEQQHVPWIARQKGKVLAALDRMERDVGGLEQSLTVGSIAVACALGYLDLRFASWTWRALPVRALLPGTTRFPSAPRILRQPHRLMRKSGDCRTQYGPPRCCACVRRGRRSIIALKRHNADAGTNSIASWARGVSRRRDVRVDPPA